MKNLFLLLLLIAAPLTAQTVLGPGDIMFTLINTDDTDAFAFVLLKDVAMGTSFRVTKGEYKSGVLQTGDGTTEISFTSASSCGAEFLFTSLLSGNGSSTGFYNPTSLNGGGSVTSALVEGSSMTLSSAGDGLIAFQGSSYITILQKCGHEFGFNDSQCSDIPPGLTEGMNAVYLNDPAFPVSNTQQREPDNVKYNCSISTGTPAQIAAALCTSSRWMQNDLNTFNYGSGCGFACQANCIEPVLNSISSSPANPCPGDQVTITINGSLGDANLWRLHEGGCNNPILQTTTSQSFTVTAGASTVYHVTVLKCNNAPICVNTSVTPAVEAANAGSDQLLVSGTSANLAANSSGSGNGMWSEISGDGNGAFGNAASPTSLFTGTAGLGYRLRWTISGGGCSTTTDDVEISFSQPITDLAAGDLAFVGYNSDPPDEFTFVMLREVSAGTTILFTDMGWMQSGGFRTSAEGLISFTFDRNYGCGDVFYFTRTVSSGNNWEAFDENSATAGSITIPPTPGLFMDIGTIGDQIFAFQGSLNSPTLLAGIHVASAWSDATDNKSSAQPPALTGNNTSINLSADVDNGIYNCGVTSGSPVTIRTATNNASNWNTSNELITLTPSCNFDCQDCIEPVITNLSINPSPVCAGQQTMITVTGNLNGANRWVVYAPGDCGGTELATSNGGNTITFTPTGTGTYLVAGVDGCVATPNCSALPITQTGLPAEITMQKPTTKVTGTSVALTTAAIDGSQTGTWSIVSGSDNSGSIADPSGPGAMLTGTAGGGYLLQYSVTGNGCPETTDQVSVSFLVDNGVSFGGMVFTGYNSSAPDNFSVVVLESLTAGTSFSVTDNGWLSAGGFRTGEQTANYLLCRPLSCGDNIRFESDGKGYASSGTVVAELQSGSTFPEIGSIGDQLFLYSGFTAPTAGDQSKFVAAIQMNCENGSCSEGSWDGDATDVSSSAKPSAFAGGGSVFGGTAPANNGRYDCANGTSNSMDLFALVTNDANWSFQNGAFTLDGCGFSCDPPPNAICQNITVEIDANGNPTTNGQPFMASDLDGGSTDNGSIDPNGFSVDITPACANITAPVTATTVTLTVADNLGQTATCTSQVTVEDNSVPTMDCTNISVELNASGEYFITNNDVYNRMTQNWMDNCAPAPTTFGSNNRTITCANSTNGTFSFFFGVQDGNGQEALCTATITVTDPTLACDDDPVAMCATTAVVQVDANGDLDLSAVNNGSTDDNTAPGDLILSIDGDVLDCDDVDMPAQMVTLIVTDNVGQTATCTSEVTVEDNIAPVITCQNIAVNLNANGTITLNTFSIANAVLTSFNDNCAANYVSLGFTLGTVGCERIGVNNLTIFYRDRPLSATSREASCVVQVQINDPLGVCGSDPVANCQPFSAGGDANGDYTLDANSLDNGSTDDRSVYTLVFDPATDRQENLTQDCNFEGVGQGQSFTAGQNGVVQTIRVRSVTAVSTTLHLYTGNNGSGIAGDIGTPAYSQAVELFASPTGAFTEVLLAIPFPVTSGSEYTFVLAGTTDLHYACNGSPSYGGGQTMVNFIQWTGGVEEDYTFQVDIIGPTTQDFSGDAEYPVTVYAVDDQGNVSAACMTTFTLDAGLPVEWLSFGANAGAKKVDLQWETSLETDNAGFHVERSATGNYWAAIGEVPARTGTDQRYDFEDSAPLQGTSYYRLRQTDFDGQITYSPVEIVEFYGDDRVVIFPNPATNEVNVQLPEGAELLGLLDVTGRMTKVRFDGENGQLRTDVSGLPAGIYFLRVRLADGALSARRLMVR